jgi:hypothetical protein
VAIYLYCLTEPACTPPAGLRGIAGGLVRSLAAGDAVAAWVSDVPAEPGPATTEQAVEHDRVVRAALAGETPLPARFGQSFADDSALCRALEPRLDSLARSLERVRGGVEMTIRIMLEETDSVAGSDSIPGRDAVTEMGGPGRAYLARLRARHEESAELQRRADFLQSRVARAVDAFAREGVCSPVMPGARSFSISHLVARAAVAEYRLAVDALVQADPALRFLVSGPWAPYSFAHLENA